MDEINVSGDEPENREGDSELCTPRPGRTRQKSMDICSSGDPTIICCTIIEELI